MTRKTGRILWTLTLPGASLAGLATPLPAQTLAPVEDEREHLSNIRQVTSKAMGLHNAGEAYFSPDGRTIIFQATPIGRKEYQIYTVDLKTGKLTLVSSGRGACTCAYFHPDGKKIIFASTHLQADTPQADTPNPETPQKSSDYSWPFDPQMDIFEADLDGSNLKRLTTTPGYDAEATYSPDGQLIVFTSQRDGDFELYVMKADGQDVRRITFGAGYDGGAFFSRDAKTILYRGDRRGDGEMNLQLRIVNADGTNDRAITDNPIFNWCPFWHPSGRCFIFTQADHRGRPNYDLFMMTVQGEHLTRITHHQAFDGLPVFSRDGKRLMWTSKRGGLDESQVFIADFKLPAAFR